MAWGDGNMLSSVVYNRIASNPPNTVTYNFTSGANYTANAPNVLDLNGVSVLYAANKFLENTMNADSVDSLS